MDDEASELEALEHIMDDANAEPIKLSYGLLRSITDNFSNEIGRGGFGVVYQGVLQNGDVAVKKLLNLHAMPEKQFVDEITCLKKAKHKNIVRFLGYCSETKGELLQFNGANVMAEVPLKLLCFEYVPNGNIKHYLQQERSHGDDWPARYKMIRGICQGLHYLHDKYINHLDLKPENVMLDSHMEPKITDFGLSRCLDEGQSKILTQNILGTLRYIAPEIIDNGEISFKSDIYALGIIIIELLTGIDKIDLDNWDESLDDKDCPAVRRCTEIARNCKDPDKRNRPTIVEIIRDLDELETSMIPLRSSINQVTPAAFPELIDLCPLELIFPFVPNKTMRCHLSLTNKTDALICCVIKPVDPGGRYCMSRFADHLPPKNTTAITLYRKEEAELPLDTEDKFELHLLILGSGCLEDLAKKLSRLPLDIDAPYEDFFKAAHELLGFELHTAMLKAVVIISEDDNPALLADTNCKEEGSMDPCNHIYSMDVHPTEPWVLIVGFGRRMYIWNWQTNEEIGEYSFKRWIIGYPEGNRAAQFIPRKHWVVTGNTDGSILVLTCPMMDQEVKKFYAHREGVTSLAVHPTRPLLLSCSSLLSIRLWDWNRAWSCTGMFEVTTPVRQVMFNPKHATTFASLHEDGKVMIRRIGYPDPVSNTQEQEGNTSGILFTYVGDRHHIFIAIGGTAYILDLRNKDFLYTLTVKNTIIAAVCHPTHPILVTASDDGFIHVWDSITYRLKKAYVNLRTRAPLHIGFTGSRRLVIGSMDGISVMDIDLE